MEMFVYLVITIVAFLIHIIFPIYIGIALYIIIKKRNIAPGFRLLSLTPILITSCLIYYYFNPTDSHYIQIYEQVTKSDFPNKAKFISTYSGDPTFLEGQTLMMVELSSVQYDALQKLLISYEYEIDTDSKEQLQSKYDRGDFVEITAKEIERPNPDSLASALDYYARLFVQRELDINIQPQVHPYEPPSSRFLGSLSDWNIRFGLQRSGTARLWRQYQNNWKNVGDLVLYAIDQDIFYTLRMSYHPSDSTQFQVHPNIVERGFIAATFKTIQ